MDIIYLLRESYNDNIEFRYSLRSLVNVKHDRVFVVGYKPKRCRNVIHIPADDDLHKYENVKRKQKIVFEYEDMSEDIIYMNDDFYFLEPQEVEYYKIGTHKKQLDYIRSRDKQTQSKGRNPPAYYENLKYVYDLFGKGDSFESHTPIVFNRQKMREMMREYPDLPPTSIRTAYCRYMKIKGKMLPNTPNYKGYEKGLCDCKVYDPSIFKVLPGQPLLSTENNMSTSKVFQEFMHSKFPEMCKYESFIKLPNIEMLFKAKPKYAISLSTRLVVFDSSGNFTTDDEKLINELSKVGNVTVVGQVLIEKKNEDIAGPKIEEVKPELDIAKLRIQYKDKFHKKAFGGRSAEQLIEKLA